MHNASCAYPGGLVKIPAPRRLVIATVGLATAALACGNSGQRDLAVTSYSPRDRADDASAIEITFDRPVVAAVQVGQPAGAGVVVLAPAADYRGHWRDRQTLVIEPSAPLRASTRYKVALAGDLEQRTSGFAFEFVHKPLVVEGVWGVDLDAIPLDGDLPIAFNQPVAAAEVAARCALVPRGGGDGGERIALVARDPGATDSTIQVRPAVALRADADVDLTCEGLTGAGGNAPLEAPYTLALHARPKLSVVRAEPTGWDVAADEVTVEIQFSTAVTLEAARAAVRARPAIKGMAKGFLDASGKRYRVTADLETETDYVVDVKAITDVHGQKLTAPFTHRFHTGTARPRISMERGIYALEAAAKGYPVWTRNVKDYQVECAAIPRDRLVQLVTTEMNYDPWGGTEEKDAIDWKALKVAPKKAPVVVPGAKNKWHLDDLDLGATCGRAARARGVYLAEVSSRHVVPDEDRPWLAPNRNRVLANVTDLGVLVKVGPASGLVWVTSLAAGAPVAGAKVSIYTPQGAYVFGAVSDAKGIVRTPGSAALSKMPGATVAGAASDGEGDGEGDWDSYRSQRLIAIVEKGDDLAVVDGNWSNGIQIWNFGVSEDRAGGATRIRGFIQSDRGLYRPGETVHFKGIVREIAAGSGPRVPKKQPVSIEVNDSRGTSVLSTTASLTGFGGFSFDLPLGAEASLGDYYVIAKVAGQVFRERFSVEEFRPAAFELTLRPGQKTERVRPGERLAFSLDASYLFGAPVAGAEVEWRVNRRDHWLRFPGYEEYSFDADDRWWWEEDDGDSGDHVADGTGTTNGRGRFEFAVRDPESRLEGPQDYVIQANVTDESDQTIGTSMVITAHQNDLYLGVHSQEYVQAVGMPFAVGVVAVDPSGKRVASPATLSFVRTRYECEWTDVGARSYQRCDRHQEVALKREIQIPATGTATERIYPKDPGDYLVKVETTDSRGNKVAASSFLWVIGKGEAFWSGDESSRMTLIASKRSYQAGDTARLVAQANLTAPTALITIERDGILEADVRTLASASEGVELAIKDAWAPNVFASVALVSGRHGAGDKNRPQFKMGVVELVVASEHKRLDVAIDLDEDTVRPGAPVKGTVRVTHQGKPVKAELSLSVADEGVLQLIAYKTPDPMKAFYASWGLGVDAGTNWNRLARLADPGSGDPDEGGDFGSSDGQRVRSRFVSSAYWAPSLVTGDDGVARFSFDAPDNLTAFRLMAVAADVGDRFGSGEHRLTINKPLMATPAFPRFLGAGDTLAVGAVVHNRTGADGTATVTLKGTGAALTQTVQTVAIAAGGTARIRFPVTASQHASASFEIGVALGKERDAVKVTLPIQRPRVIETRTAGAGQLAAGQTADAAIAVPAAALRGESQLAITVDRTGVGDLEPSLRYLVQYPYGCLEQTLSRFIPLVKARDLAASLDMKSLGATQGTTKMDTFIKAGVAKVARHQQGDGHFSLWPSSQTYPHLTAYALWGLLEAKKAGVAVPQDTIDRGLHAIASWIQGGEALKPGGDAATLAMAAFVLADQGKPDAGLMARLYDLRAGLPRWGQAFLLRALVAGKGDAAMIAEVRGLLVAAVTVTGERALVREARGEHDYYMNSDVRASAMTLAAFIAAGDATTEPLIEKLVAGLKSERDAGGAWRNTQDNLWSLVALADYARRAAPGEATVTITAGDQVLAKKKLIGGEVHVVRSALDKVTADQIRISADGPIHYAVRVTQVSKDSGAARASGFAIRREYLDARGAATTTVKAGELVTVRLTVQNDAHRRWIAMVDPLPAGLEAVNPRLATAVTTGGTAASPGRGQRGLSWAHQELRDDQVQWFADWMPQGTYVLSYQARATIDGSFAVAPARIEAMYQPEVMGRTTSTTLTVSR
jgi:uncharacterized protein YfaS (alpha-2-macroglobulin family)